MQIIMSIFNIITQHKFKLQASVINKIHNKKFTAELNIMNELN